MLQRIALLAALLLLPAASRADDASGIATAPGVAGPSTTAATPAPSSTPAAASGAPAPAQAAPDSALPPLPQLDRIDLAKMHAGKVISDAIDNDGHGGKVSGYAVCHCSVEALWAVLTHHADFPEFVPRVTAMQVSNRTEHGERALQTVDATISTVRYALDYFWDPSTRHIEFHLVEDVPHDLKAVQGSWQLWPIDHGAYTLLAYQSVVDTGRQIPGFIRDYLADRGVKDNMDAMRKRAESHMPRQ